MGLPGVKVATTHKLLHHKRPTVFPLIDNVTKDAYGKRRAWKGIHADLQNSAQDWEGIETRFAALAQTNNGAELSRLRMHDIVLWCARVDPRQLESAEEKGSAILELRGDSDALKLTA